MALTALVTPVNARTPRWREWLFALVARHAQAATSFFGLPPDAVVEIGTQVKV